MRIQQVTTEYYDNSGGLDLQSSPTKTEEDKSTDSLNVDYSVDGSAGTALGSIVVNVTGTPPIPSPISGNPNGLELFDFHKEDATEYQLICAGDSVYVGLDAPVATLTGLTADLQPDFEKVETNDGEKVIFGNGTDDNKITDDGTVWVNLSLPTPTAPAVVDFAVGTLVAGDYQYYYSHAVTSGGIIVKEGELSPVSNTLTIAANRTIRIPISVSSDAQVNARVIYRVSPTSLGVAYRHVIVADNITTNYDDTTATDGTIEAEYDNQPAPTSAVIENNDFGETFYVDASEKNVVRVSKPYQPWNVPTENEILFDGPVSCIKRIFGVLIFGTDKSIWILNGAFYNDNAARRVSSKIGILNNRCAVGLASLYILATDRKVYNFSPTDFSQDEIRIGSPISKDIDSQFGRISANQLPKVKMEYFVKADSAKVYVSCAISENQNNTLIILNEKQSLAKDRPVWQIRNNIYASALKQLTVNSVDDLYALDYYGLVWKLEVENQYGDGSEENGTITAATSTVITDSSQSWTVNELVGKRFRCISGVGDGQEGLIISNTATTLTLQTATSTTCAVDDEFTVGGYDAYHFTNWKSVNGSYDDLKQLHDFFSNLNTSAGSSSYPITVIFQFDYDASEANQEEFAISLSSSSTVWGSFIWGAAVWGERSVFQDRLRKFGRFRAIRIGIKNRKAGQPWQLNGFSLTTSNRGKLYPKAS